MDFYGTAATAIDHVIKVTIFIKGVISDIKDYDDDRASIQLKLDLQLTSLEFFRRRFLDEKNGLMLPGRLPEWIADTICDLLLKMSRVLAEYRVLVGRYDDFDEKVKVSEEGDSVSKREKWKQSFLERAKTQAKALKMKGYDWSLFDKKKLLGIMEEYQGWTSNLRDVMQHFSQEMVYNIADSASTANNESLKGTGLEQVVQRQKLISSQPPDDFQELQGDIAEEGSPSNRFQPARWTCSGESLQVLVEYREYDRRLRLDDLDPEEIAELKEPVRNLAWLLQNSTFHDGGENANEPQQPAIYSLQCLGFMDQVEKERTAFVYKLPSLQADGETETGVKICTLHDLITKVDVKTKRPLKPSLTDRFSIAHCLALTLSNVHASLWLHKNIWSRGILLFQQNKEGVASVEIQRVLVPPNGAERSQIVAFLGDWGYARHVEGATDMRSDFEIEPNIYRHPERQGAPTRQFARPHDIYALGVVLLEIGLWKTVSQLFDARIKEGQRTGKLPKPKDVRNALVALSQTELPREMGIAYASAVVRCLTSDFRKTSDTELSLDFREKVVDAIALGMKL
ncbi:uncharacterized protein CIMG_08011 [Coccidioides immitis RS]|uniref:Protein kinase domain-containing protein n=1 Tax=Coccidioides immitis (strain RS) TaxID=246410 RepID=J3K4L4_COCIM|nr:uncharacterized protein CIMG_08011 [Coccidioides immitis RS]EAS29265.3 hypothetical protein CIMG_08011 [Coccidioides immitis RS]TPX22623.1 hypothetical protein DIZ76_014500 [Coccidioides immitis]